ncbi:hypothetical protein TUM12147_46520 [Citrobacter europaeus]|nr:hypothetical protein TUM12147_46520 [Citrobacter europaeus]
MRETVNADPHYDTVLIKGFSVEASKVERKTLGFKTAKLD